MTPKTVVEEFIEEMDKKLLELPHGFATNKWEDYITVANARAFLKSSLTLAINKGEESGIVRYAKTYHETLESLDKQNEK